MKGIEIRRVRVVLALIAAIGGCFAWNMFPSGGLPAGIASGNGRIEAVERTAAGRNSLRLPRSNPRACDIHPSTGTCAKFQLGLRE